MKPQLLSLGDLSRRDRESMYALLDQHFMGVESEVFSADLAQKNWILLLKDESSGTLQGFTTFSIDQTEFQGELINVVYSGDTIVDPMAWGSSALPKAWLSVINQLRQDYSEGRFYWLLICSGYRTYRFLPVFAKDFYPRYDRQAKDWQIQLVQQLAIERFGSAYNPATGIVKLAHPQQLRGTLNGIPKGRLDDPHVAFFNQVNPGHENGDELVCLTEISEANLTAAGQRIAGLNKRLVGGTAV